MVAKRCWECNNTFYTDFGATHCNVCKQAIDNRRHADRRARQDRWEAEQAHRENARIQARHTQALINAENARIDAINHQTKVIRESSITSKEAYNRGYSYIDIEWKFNNPSELSMFVDESGKLNWVWYHLYYTDRLNDQFANGLSARLNQVKNVHDVVKAGARLAGKQHAEGTLKGTFEIVTGLQVNGVGIKTKTFDSKFTTFLDEKTGELTMRWTEPFDNPILNKEYLDGVNEVHDRVNTNEQKNYRLMTEVPQLKAERAIAKATKRVNKLFGFLVYVIPILFFLLMWQVTSGIVTLGMAIIAVFMRSALKTIRSKWAQNNKYLGK